MYDLNPARLIKLYDMYLRDHRNENVKTFQMRAPLHVILQTINLFNDQACKRVEFETKNGGTCTLMKNDECFVIERAKLVLDIDCWSRQVY